VKVPSRLRAAVKRDVDPPDEYGNEFTRQWSKSSSPCGGQPVPNGNQKGYSVAISGKTAVVGIPGIASDEGSAYVFEEVGKTWHRVAKLNNRRNAIKDVYAFSVAISSSKAGTYIAIGGNDYNCMQNLVYIFTGSGKNWHLQQKIADPGNNPLDMFGDSVAISSRMLIVGASCRNNFSGTGYVYLRFGISWSLEQTLPNPLGLNSDSFGESVSMTGSTIFVGAGAAAYVYTKQSRPHWKLTATLLNPGPNTDAFGDSATIEGSTAIVGAPNDDSGAGSAYVWQLVGTTWQAMGKLKAFHGVLGGEFGFSVNLTGNRLIIGMPNYNSCGTAFVFRSSGTKWIHQAQIMNPQCSATNDGFGFSVSGTNSSMGIFGAPATSNGAGAAYMLPLSTKP
jgi:hypothetical protein